MSNYSISTVLIPAQQWALRSRKRRGSVACTEQGGGSEITNSIPLVRISRVRSKCILEDETQWGVNIGPVSHGDLGDTSTFAEGMIVRPRNRQSRRAFNEKVNGVESQPNHDATSHSVNMGSPKLAVNRCLYGDGVPILPKSQPVMGVTVGIQPDSALPYKFSSNGGESRSAQRESGTVFVLSQNARKEEC